MLNIKLLPDEKTVRLFRQSLWVLLWPLCFSIFLTIFPLYLLQKYELFTEFWKFFALWFSLLFAFGFYKYILWLLTILIVTNQRIIYIKHIGIFTKQIFDPRLPSLSHISVESKAPWGLLGIKTLSITIGGASEALVIPNLAEAEHAKEIISGKVISTAASGNLA